jgi:hypothetical protein
MAWVSPTGHDDPDSEWGNEAQIYDDDTETLGYCNSSGHYLYLMLTSPIRCDKVRSWWDTSSGDASVEIWVYYSEGWHKIHDGVITKGEWVETSIGSTQTVEKAGIALNISTLHYFYEFDFNEVGDGGGWQGKIAGVTNPAKMMGVDAANIAKVKGVPSA